MCIYIYNIYRRGDVKERREERNLFSALETPTVTATANEKETVEK